MKKIVLFLPLTLLLAVVLFLVMQLRNTDTILPSEDWNGKPFPEFSSVSLLDPNQILNKQNFPKEPFLLNVWASWCTWCIKEFPMLLELKEKGVPIVGLTYVDKPDDARKTLTQWGNPFLFVIDDSEKDFLIQTLNVSSAPSTYLIDQNGVIRYQQKGYSSDFMQEIVPRLDALREHR